MIQLHLNHPHSCENLQLIFCFTLLTWAASFLWSIIMCSIWSEQICVYISPWKVTSHSEGGGRFSLALLEQKLSHAYRNWILQRDSINSINKHLPLGSTFSRVQYLSTTIEKTMFINPWETSYIQPQQDPDRIPSWEVAQTVTLGNPPAAHSLPSDIMSLPWWLIAGSSMPPSDARTPLPHQRFQSEQRKAMRQGL